MSIATPLLKVPPPVMIALLRAHAPVEPACPFGFLLQSSNLAGRVESSAEAEHPLASHVEWLRQNQLVAAEGDVLLPQWQRALQIATHPRSRISVVDSAGGKVSRAMFVSDGRELIFAMFDRQHCLISEPFSFTESVERLLRNIGVSKDSGEPPRPLCTNPDVMRLMGALAMAGLGERPSKHRADGKAPSVRALSEQRAADVLGEVLDDPAMGSALLVDMMADRLIMVEQGKVWVHPQFVPWHRAISSGAMLEIVRQELPKGQVPAQESEVQRGVFLGPAQDRCLMWPSPTHAQEVILAYPTHKPLRDILLFLLGAPDTDDVSLQETLARTNKKFSFRG